VGECFDVNPVGKSVSGWACGDPAGNFVGRLVCGDQVGKCVDSHKKLGVKEGTVCKIEYVVGNSVGCNVDDDLEGKSVGCNVNGDPVGKSVGRWIDGNQVGKFVVE